MATYHCKNKNCGKKFKRSDYLVKHERSCKGGLWCPRCQKMFSRHDNLNRHMKTCTKGNNILRRKYDESDAELEANIQKDNDKYLEKLHFGQKVYETLQKNPNVDEASLREEYKEALELYQESTGLSLDIDMESISLKPWQRDIVNLIDNPSEREIIWIVGQNGNEGKTFL